MIYLITTQQSLFNNIKYSQCTIQESIDYLNNLDIKYDSFIHEKYHKNRNLIILDTNNNTIDKLSEEAAKFIKLKLSM